MPVLDWQRSQRRAVAPLYSAKWALNILRVGLHLRCIFPCYAAEHAIIHLDRYLYRLYDRRTNSGDLGRRHALLLGSAAQWRRRRCGAVARVASVKMIVPTVLQKITGPARGADVRPNFGWLKEEAARRATTAGRHTPGSPTKRTANPSARPNRIYANFVAENAPNRQSHRSSSGCANLYEFR